MPLDIIWKAFKGKKVILTLGLTPADVLENFTSFLCKKAKNDVFQRAITTISRGLYTWDQK